MEAGIEVALELASSTDLFGTGEMGIGNTTPSSAIVAALSGARPVEVTGRGTGLDDAGLKRKIDELTAILALNRPDPSDPIDVLAKVGGFEIGGIAGLILGRPACASRYWSTVSSPPPGPSSPSASARPRPTT